MASVLPPITTTDGPDEQQQGTWERLGERRQPGTANSDLCLPSRDAFLRGPIQRPSALGVLSMLPQLLGFIQMQSQTQLAQELKWPKTEEGVK